MRCFPLIFVDFLFAYKLLYTEHMYNLAEN